MPKRNAKQMTADSIQSRSEEEVSDIEDPDESDEEQNS
jgi:hypothetical protein